MKKQKWMTAVAVLALSASLAVAGEGKYGKHGGHGRHGRGELGAKLAEKLNLTDAQKLQVKDISKSFRDENKAFFESSHATMKEYRAAKEAGDTAKADSLKNTVEQNRAHFRQLREAQRARILTILTPEQRAQWEALKAQREQRHRERQ